MTSKLVDKVESTLIELAIKYIRKGDNQFLLELPGENKLKTTTLLTVDRHGLRIEAFVCRKPDENTEKVYAYLLQRNRRLFGVHYAIDKIGDIYLLGRMTTSSCTEEELDRLLGQILEASDGDFNILLELGFAESIRREWNWRISRGEPLANLKAFEHLIL